MLVRTQVANDRITSAALVIIGLSMTLEVNLIGRLNGADVILLALLPFLLMKRGAMLLEQWPRRILIAAGAWFIAQMLTDLIRQTAFEDLVRGWAKILVFAANLMSLTMLTRYRFRLVSIFLLAVFAASSAKVYIGVGDFALLAGDFGSQWKYSYGIFCTAVALLLAGWVSSSTSKRIRLNWPAYLLSVYSLYVNARTLFAVSAISALLNNILRPGRIMSRQRQLVFGLAGIGAAALLVDIYSYTASSGILGLAALEKYEAQSQGSAGLLSGRAEMFGSSQAIVDSPLIGHGSWARDSRYVDIMFQRLIEMGVPVDDQQYYGADLIPSHSHIMGAWVEAGIVGAVFWGICLWIAVASLMACIRAPDHFVGFSSFMLLKFLWTIPFSPFGNDLRVIDAAWLCLAIGALTARERETNGVPVKGMTWPPAMGFARAQTKDLQQ